MISSWYVNKYYTLSRLKLNTSDLQNILQSALDYRFFNLRVYGVELPMIDPWTSQPTIIDIVAELFETTAKLVESPSADADPSPSKDTAKAQLPELASSLFSIYHEQLEWLSRYVLCSLS